MPNIIRLFPFCKLYKYLNFRYKKTTLSAYLTWFYLLRNIDDSYNVT
jgi:hypothetical protein